jgi:hypothetical protein
MDFGLKCVSGQFLAEMWGARRKILLPKEKLMIRRLFLSRFAQLAALPFALTGSSLGGQAAHKSLKILMKSAWGSDDPTKAAFPFLHGLALAEAGHEV